MTNVRSNGAPPEPEAGPISQPLAADRLRTIVQDSHINFLFGAGTPSSFIAPLGDIEEALTKLAGWDASEEAKSLVRASIQGHFFKNVLVPNLQILELDPSTVDVRTSYEGFLRTLNQILLKRSSLLAKQANLFTTNVDMVFEIALESLGIDFSDGFTGKIRPRLDLGDFNTLRLRMGSRYEHRSEVPVFNLIKLHGSVGWMQEPRLGTGVEIFFDHRLSLVTRTKTAFEGAQRHLIDITEHDDIDVAELFHKAAALDVIPDEVARFTAAYDELGIVNPDKHKFASTVLNETYYELIRRFANALEKENSVLFVHGFSFRDEHLRSLVLRAARTNPTLQVIVFCYSRADKAGYEVLLPAREIKNGNVLYVAPPKPDGGEVERRATLDVVNSEYFKKIIADKVASAEQRNESDILIPVPAEEPAGA